MCKHLSRVRQYGRVTSALFSQSLVLWIIIMDPSVSLLQNVRRSCLAADLLDLAWILCSTGSKEKRKNQNKKERERRKNSFIIMIHFILWPKPF